MNQSERRIFLINELIRERNGREIAIPKNEEEQKRLLRSLLNIRPPKEMKREVMKVQDEYLRREIEEKGVTKLTDMKMSIKDIYLRRGDITLLSCGAIVNAANSKMLGCFCPCHGCIDNAIHTFAGAELRLECAQIMEKRGCDEKVGGAILTKAYNLPCEYVIHTVGPFISGEVTAGDKNALVSCYESCLTLADENNISSIAFCCISTGEFHFPQKAAAETAIKTVISYKKRTKSEIKVIFNVFKESDFKIYDGLIGRYKDDL